MSLGMRLASMSTRARQMMLCIKVLQVELFYRQRIRIIWHSCTNCCYDKVYYMKKLLKVFPIIIVLCFISLNGCKKEVPCICGNPAGVVYVDYFGAPPTYKTLEEYLLEADGIVYATYTGKYEDVYIHSEFEENIFKKPDPCCCHGGEKYLLMADPQSKEDSIFKEIIANLKFYA